MLQGLVQQEAGLLQAADRLVLSWCHP